MIRHVTFRVGRPLGVQRWSDFDQYKLAQLIRHTLRRGWGKMGYHFTEKHVGHANVMVHMCGPRVLARAFPSSSLNGFSVCQRLSPTYSVIYFHHGNWTRPPPAFTGSKMTYRQYLISHEFGHALGRGHRQATQVGEWCPVMYQQTRGTRTCRPNPWPWL